MAKFDVDYPHVRENADIIAVLAHYDVELDGDGEQRKGLCPFHSDTRPSLNVNVQRNLFKCHGCGAGGNVIKLVQLLDPKLENPRRAALQIAQLSGISAKPDGQPMSRQSEPPVRTLETRDERPAEAVSDAAEVERDGRLFNRPLTFTLQLGPVTADDGSAASQFVEEHGLAYERLSELGAGMGLRGSMKDRLAFPIRNVDGEIVAYVGRDVGLLAGEDEPLYKLPAKFHPEFELFGWDVAQYFDRIVLVDDFLPVVKFGGEASKFGETGFGVASLMGDAISDRQLELLMETQPEVIVCFGDADGAAQVAAQVALAGLWVRVERGAAVNVPEVDSDDFCHVFGKV